MLEQCSFGVWFPRSGFSSVPHNVLLQNHGLDGTTVQLIAGIGSAEACPEDLVASPYTLEHPGADSWRDTWALGMVWHRATPSLNEPPLSQCCFWTARFLM